MDPIRHSFRLLSFALLALKTTITYGAPEATPILSLEQWSGVSIQAVADNSLQTASFDTSKPISFTYPDGEKGWHRVGLASAHDGSSYWRDQYGVRVDLHNPSDTNLNVTATIFTAPTLKGREPVVSEFTSKISFAGKGWHTVTIPIASFDYEKARPFVLEAIKTFQIQAYLADGSPAELQIRNPHLVEADSVSLKSKVRSKSAKGGESVTYELTLTNCTDTPQAVTLSRIIRGREEIMHTTLTPDSLTLAPGESQNCEVQVTMSKRVPPGGRESQLIQAMANGQDAGQIEFITLSHMERPYILHTKERWDAVREKAKTVDWAKKAAQEYIDNADKWKVPAADHGKRSSRTKNTYLYTSGTERAAMGAAVAYQLTGELKYAKKAALYYRQLSDPTYGYPVTKQANQTNLVKEGAFFQYVAMGYDMIYNSGVLSTEDHANLETTFRIFHEIIDQHITFGDTGNWQVAELIGCIYTGLALQDMAVVNRFIEGPMGFYDQLSHGVMSDGWWYECSIGYNAWVSREFTQLAFAMQPWGVDYQFASFPATYSQEYNIPYADVEQRKQDYMGKPFQKWGPVHKPYIKITDMWDAMIPYIDYNGVMFALNDSTEKKLDSLDYEVAYYAYRKPEYASILKNGSKRDLLYGVAELPEDTPELGNGSAYSDNVGVTMIRSKAEGQEPREKIQAVLKYGTHGGYHGHFDRASLNSLMRYGRSFYNPEHIWYSYPNFMYAFFVQTSLPHNMVVVDMKQQEPVESSKILFSEGDMMQATAVETNARWSNPPYGGLFYSTFKGTFQDKCWDEGRYMPQPENEPEYASIGEYSDRVMQRRLLAVTDDYVVVADYLDAPEEHTFDHLYNIKGFKGIEADELKLTRTTESMNPDPVLAAQLITDCDWYDSKGTTKVSFETQFGPKADNTGTRIYGEDGILKMDIYNAWPKEREVMIGTLPEAHWVNRKLWYSVVGDDKVLTEGKFGAWVLGRDEIDVSVEGIKTMNLKTRADFNDKKAPKTLFWGNPVIITADGKEIDLNELKLTFDQIDNSPKSGVDYKGGPIKIAGREFERSVPANPFKSNVDGTITVDLSGLNATRFHAFIGGDYPIGDETWRRKSLSFRTTGKQTQYLTVIDPYEEKSLVKSVNAQSANKLTVELLDGRTHEITISNLEIGKDLQISIKEFKDNQLVSEEEHHNK
ncbi:MAG: hypothetical protein ABF330_08490 [Lentimonas sp.]